MGKYQHSALQRIRHLLLLLLAFASGVLLVFAAAFFLIHEFVDGVWYSVLAQYPLTFPVVSLLLFVYGGFHFGALPSRSTKEPILCGICSLIPVSLLFDLIFAGVFIATAIPYYFFINDTLGEHLAGIWLAGSSMAVAWFSCAAFGVLLFAALIGVVIGTLTSFVTLLFGTWASNLSLLFLWIILFVYHVYHTIVVFVTLDLAYPTSPPVQLWWQSLVFALAALLFYLAALVSFVDWKFNPKNFENRVWDLIRLCLAAVAFLLSLWCVAWPTIIYLVPTLCLMPAYDFCFHDPPFLLGVLLEHLLLLLLYIPLLSHSYFGILIDVLVNKYRD